MPAIYHEGSWLGNATDPEVLVKDTVGWTGKNRAYSQTNNAVIAHIENGITYDVSWTGSATVTLKKNSTSGATITSGNTSPLSFTADADYELYFGSSATVTNIMVKDSRITDPTYEPYHESVEEEIEQIYADNGVLGAKNLLNPTYAGGTVNGVTITTNENKTYELNGAPSSGNMAVAIYTGTFPVGRYILNGVPDFTTYGARLHIRETAGASQVDAIDTGKGIEFAIPSATTSYSVFMYLNSGYTANNLIIKPMIRLASDPDDTYQPYAMTNRELTEKVFEKRTLTSADDLNNITETGIYGVTSAPLNSPESTSYYTLIVQKTSDSDIRQTIFKGGYIYHRYYGGSPTAWKSWYKFTGTVVS